MKKFFVMFLVLLSTISLSASISSKKSGKMVPNPYSRENIARHVTGRPYTNDLYMDENDKYFYADNDAFISEDSLNRILEMRKSKLVDTSFVIKPEASDKEDDINLSSQELKEQIALDSLLEEKRKLDSLSESQNLEKAKREELLAAQNDEKVGKILLIIFVVVIVALILNGRLSSVEENHKK